MVQQKWNKIGMYNFLINILVFEYKIILVERRWEYPVKPTLFWEISYLVPDK